ncbi:hypothetical protein [Pedobacter flavus]|uniref:Helicase ATP-binding domain-containing protein n=1 Tax=Pedobacter flavus TaxID=3113906 RepID=A0ABU7GZA6_9SPHI|nr:hypothetical protein [Pedobacter sp. VNH31]MEE1884364.1 hypothetical protein [Pedobacter sp. VNH31]
MMEKVIINIHENHRDFDFKELLFEYGFDGLIPSNTFIDKVRSGIGGTTSELESDRNSIIIVPFVDVERVKKEKYKTALCIVMNGIHNKNIEDYINDKSIAFKKIMTTPEGFIRLISVLNRIEIHYRSKYFLLYDESDRLIEDCLFREKLLAPLSEFFQFTKKAFISATPIIPSDPRLREQQFKHLVFKPTWDYSTPLKLITTDNIRTSIRNYLSLLNDDKPVFIFTNCKETILFITRLDGVKEDYKVFCAEQLNENYFKYENVENIEHSVKQQKYAKFNLFTSRFFYAVDMFYNGSDKPHILMLTNLPSIKHSIINPNTTAIQIKGRCRKGISSVTHITTLLRSRVSKSHEEIIRDIDFSLSFIEKLKRSSLSFMNSSVQRIVDELIGKEFAKNIYNGNGKIETYIKDAFINQELVSNDYVTAENLIKAYNSTSHFKIEHINVTHMFTDRDLLSIDTLKNKKKYQMIVKKLEDIEQRLLSGEPMQEEDVHAFNLMIGKEPILFALFCNYGADFFEKIHYQRTKMRKTFFALKLSERQFKDSNMIDEILFTFKLNTRLNSDYIKDTLNAIYNKYYDDPEYCVPENASATHILKYFEGTYNNGKRKHPIHGYKSYYRLTRPKYKLSEDVVALQIV